MCSQVGSRKSVSSVNIGVAKPRVLLAGSSFQRGRPASGHSSGVADKLAAPSVSD